MNKEIERNTEISQEDALFLKELGFSKIEPAEENTEDSEELKGETWDSYSMDMEDHPFIDDLYVSVNVKQGFIQAYGRGAYNAFIEKPFTQENTLAVMKFLGFLIATRA